MTLNVTLTSPRLILQVSDRRFSDISGNAVDDEGNKAIVVGFADSLVTISFAGLATFKVGTKIQRLDHWLVDQMQEAGIPELTPDDAAAFIAKKATKLFSQLRGNDQVCHSFVMAGWSFKSGGSPRAIARVIANDPAHGSSSFAVSSFVAPEGKVGILVTGCKDAITRPIRRRMLTKLTRGKTIREAEATVVDAIREAASDPSYRKVINADCMSVAISSSGQARATFYAEQRRPETRAPMVLWNSRGASIQIRDGESLIGSGYGIAFGEPPSPFQLLLGGPALARTNGQSRFDAQISVSPPKHGPPLNVGDKGLLFTMIDKPVPFD